MTANPVRPATLARQRRLRRTVTVMAAGAVLSAIALGGCSLDDSPSSAPDPRMPESGAPQTTAPAGSPGQEKAADGGTGQFTGVAMPQGLRPLRTPVVESSADATVTAGAWAGDAAPMDVLGQTTSANPNLTWKVSSLPGGVRATARERAPKALRVVTIDAVWSPEAKETLVRALDSTYTTAR